MTTHELARILLEKTEDLPIALHVNNHTYVYENAHFSHGEVKIGLMHTSRGDHVCIGNISKRNIQKPSYYIKEMIKGEAPEEW